MTGPERLTLEARRWLGTPFCEGAAVRGAGTDCAGLVMGVLGGLGVPVEPAADIDSALTANAAILVPAGLSDSSLVVLARDPGGPPVHLALRTPDATLIHAHWSRGVVENSCGRWFAARVVATFQIRDL